LRQRRHTATRKHSVPHSTHCRGPACQRPGIRTARICRRARRGQRHADLLRDFEWKTPVASWWLTRTGSLRVDKLIVLEHAPMAWEADVAKLKTPILIIQGDADIIDPGHTLAMFRLLGGGVMGGQGKPLPESRLAILPGTSHTAIMGRTGLLRALIEPFLNGETPRGWFEPQAK
jgi:pimeloyl-ACP methyl ester carboxylesterase